MTEKTAPDRENLDSKTPGHRFGALAAIPGLISAGAIALLGAPVAVAVAIPAAVAVAVVAPLAASGSAAAAAAGILAIGAGVVAAGAGVFAIGSGAIGLAAAAGGATTLILGVAAIADKTPNLKKAFASALAGSAFGAALTCGAAITAPQAPMPAEQPVSSAALRIEAHGDRLSRDFNLAENAVSGADHKGGKTYTLTVDKNYAPQVN